MTSTVLVTGANGFVGRALVTKLAAKGFHLRGAVRQCDRVSNRVKGVEWCPVGDVGPRTDWSGALLGVDAIVHLVARTHTPTVPGDDSLTLYRTINVGGTRRLAEQAVAAGVRRFVFVSSIKVNGERTFGQPFRANDTPAPVDSYGISKREGEEALVEVATDSGLETVVVRPPLVYGTGVKGNFRRLMSLVAKGVPLPLGSVNNRRSLVALDNLVDLLETCVDAPEARDRTFLVSDGDPLSTPELIRSIAAAFGRSARLLPVPTAVLELFGRLTRHVAELERLCGSLEVDTSETRELLAWRPRVGTHEAIRATVEDFVRGQTRSPDGRKRH